MLKTLKVYIHDENGKIIEERSISNLEIKVINPPRSDYDAKIVVNPLDAFEVIGVQHFVNGCGELKSEIRLLIPDLPTVSWAVI